MNQKFWALALVGAAAWACSSPSTETPEALPEQPFEYAAQLDTLELGEERVYAVNYQLIGGLKAATVQYQLNLVAGSRQMADTLTEYLQPGDTLSGTYLFVDVPVSEGTAAFSSHLEILPSDVQ
ncbi:MAG: hypothetical protein EBZ31_01920 [Flavobacteriia bacterium]|jgi:hypothetical protein|nr:hypothetical protein [Flavobacteriia bacterium]